MSHVDQFESFFRAATKERFHAEAVKIQRILTLTDLAEGESAAFEARIKAFVPPRLAGADWKHLSGTARRTVAETLAAVKESAPDLVCTYRNLYTETWHWPYSLGEHLDVLTQVNRVPVLVLPHPGEPDPWEKGKGAQEVMAITDHLTGDARLVSWGVAFTRAGGTLHLTHVEDQAFFDRAIDVIGKLPMLDTDIAREEMHRQLLKEPADYIESARGVLKTQAPSLTVAAHVTMGHRLSEVRRLIEAHNVDLLVLNTKDDDQLAMHGLAHPMAVELRHVPMLML